MFLPHLSIRNQLIIVITEYDFHYKSMAFGEAMITDSGLGRDDLFFGDSLSALKSQ
jgi:hypothetical protein